jgi:hypothetical protein
VSDSRSVLHSNGRACTYSQHTLHPQNAALPFLSHLHSGGCPLPPTPPFPLQDLKRALAESLGRAPSPPRHSTAPSTPRRSSTRKSGGGSFGGGSGGSNGKGSSSSTSRTSEKGKLKVLTSGSRAAQNRARERLEGVGIVPRARGVRHDDLLPPTRGWPHPIHGLRAGSTRFPRDDTGLPPTDCFGDPSVSYPHNEQAGGGGGGADATTGRKCQADAIVSWLVSDVSLVGSCFCAQGVGDDHVCCSSSTVCTPLPHAVAGG